MRHFFFLTLILFSIQLLAQNSIFRFFDPQNSLYQPEPQIATHLPYEGQAEEILQWDDLNGQNILIISRKNQPAQDNDSGFQQMEIFIYHYVLSEDQEPFLKRRLYDFEKECSFDINLEIIPASLTLTDLDEDRITEICFLYKKACRDTLRPATLKLMMIENGQKYALRGYTELGMIPETDFAQYDPNQQMGTYRVSSSFKKVEAGFLAFARHRWEMFKVEADY